MPPPISDVKGASSPQRSGKEIRQEVRDYIKNERDTVLMKWLTLGETVKTIDRTKETFEKKRIRRDKTMPTNIQKFIGTLKRCVRRAIKQKGGTPYSIVRSLFMYWGTGGSGPSGTLNAEQLSKCMQSLGIVISSSAIDEVIDYYAATGISAASSDAKQMSYDELILDVTADEPTVIMDTGNKYFDADDISVRFTEIEDAYVVMPTIVKHFVEATQNYVMNQMRVEGGTPHYHVRELFNRFDYNQSSGLDPTELQKAAQKKMKLNMTRDQAREVVKYYDRKRIGQMSYEAFAAEIAKGTKPMLDFTEITSEERQKAIQSLSVNPLMPKPFQSKPNRVLEDLKLRLKALAEKAISTKGGSLESVISDAFRSYDKNFSQTLAKWQDIQGVMAKLSISIDRETALMLMRAYDVHSNGIMHYSLFIKEIVSEDSHFLNTVEFSPVKSHSSVSARTPASVAKTIQMFKNSCNVYARKSGGALHARDLLYGTCLRFDSDKCGRIPPFAVMNVARELNVAITEDQVHALVDWFDSNAAHALDYNLFTRQVYGTDVMNSVLQLPKLNKSAGRSDYHETVKYGSPTRVTEAVDNAKTTELPTAKAQIPTVFSSGGLLAMMHGSTGETASSPTDKASPKKHKDHNYVPLKKTVDEPVGGADSAGKLNILAESPATQAARLAQKREQVLRERKLISDKLSEVDDMRKRLSDAYSKRKNDAYEAQLRQQHEQQYAERLAKRAGK